MTCVLGFQENMDIGGVEYGMAKPETVVALPRRDRDRCSKLADISAV